MMLVQILSKYGQYPFHSYYQGLFASWPKIDASQAFCKASQAYAMQKVHSLEWFRRWVIASTDNH